MDQYFDECFVKHIFGIFPVPAIPQAQAQKRRSIAVVQGLYRTPVIPYLSLLKNLFAFHFWQHFINPENAKGCLPRNDIIKRSFPDPHFIEGSIYEEEGDQSENDP
jgi:hypothetical protein